MDPVIIENVTKSFRVKVTKNSNNKFFALNNISFSVKHGEMFGIIGRNGSGKTTLMRIIAGIYLPDSGNVDVTGKLSPLLQIGTGFQDELIAAENIIMNGLLLGFSKSEIKGKIDGIIKFAGLENFTNLKLKNYSSGMKARLAFSTAMHVDPDILLADEILSVGDIIFRKKSFETFLKFKEQNKTIIFSSHNLGVIKKLCDRVLLLDEGKNIMLGSPDEVITKYKSMFDIKETENEND